MRNPVLVLILALAGCHGQTSLTPQEVVARCNTVVAGEQLDPGLACFQAEPTLPTAVQFGDSTSKGYALSARHDLCGVVDYRHDDFDTGDIDLCGEAYKPYDEGLAIEAGANNGYSTTLVNAMETRLNDRHYNVVLFNSGYHDLQHDAADVGAVRISESMYRDNLEAAAQVCEQSADICVWIDTPGLASATARVGDPVVDNDKIPVYNAIAEAVAHEHGFYILNMPDTGHQSDSVHFTSSGYAALGQRVSACVVTALTQAETDTCHK